MKAHTFQSSAFKRFKTSLALVATTALALTGFGYLPVASAADNPGVVITIDQLVRSDANGNEQGGGARVNDVVKMKFTWDATAANPQPGQSFSIALPPEFNNREPGTTKDLVADGVTAAKCTVEVKKLSCTFTDEIVGKHNIKGSGSALLQATQTTATNQVEFRVNDAQALAVTLPGGVPIGAAAAETYSESKFGKAISPLAHNSKALVWSISFGSPFLKSLPGYTPDGQTNRTIVMRDTLAPGQKFSTDKSQYYLRIGNSAGVIRPNPKPNLTNAAGVDATTEFGNYDFTVDLVSEREAVFTLTGPWLPDTNYSIGYTAFPVSDTGFVKPGVEYTNSVEVPETGARESFTRSYTESFTIDIQMEDGFGSFKTTKLLSGEGFSLVPAGTKFKVKATWVLPAGKTAANYPTWTPPANPAVMEVEVGKAAQFNGTFPEGTVVTVTEELPAVTGVKWQNPLFRLGRATQEGSLQFTVENKKSTSFDIVNTADNSTGKFSVTKVVTGLDTALVADKVFAFDYDCGDAGTGKLEVKAGQVVESPAIKTGATCTISEADATAGVDGYTVAPPAPKQVVIAADTVTAVEMNNVYSAKQGKFSITKTVTGIDQGLVADKDFSFTYDCGPGKTGSLTVKAGVTVESVAIDNGSVCTITEDATAAAVANYTVVVPAPKQVTVTSGQVANAAFENAYTLKKGKFSITKQVTDVQADDVDDKEFKFTYDCAGTVGTLQVKAGETVAGPDLDHGTVCMVTEDADAAQVDGYTVEVPASQNVTIVAETTTDVKFTNVYKEKLGQFSVTKTVKGLQTDKAFTFHYACSGGSTGLLQVKAGQTVTGPQLRDGVECVISEQKDSARVTGYKLTVPEAQKVTVETDKVVKAEFVNTYVKVVKPTLPATGASVAGLLGVAAVALALGIFLRRRWS